ncbi:ATP-binding protein [Undibacterium pigrum]|uniref:Uncharacterized protein n=1 Tax=Undibacterium pigrum TaxID=401470 RepID=A0A318IRL2_9BURK|nr:ATP-binding protein [Undibacterium pigrum]PXX37995.1 hypothetical protein DFR42_11369 [Undibacterium pigrum]
MHPVFRVSKQNIQQLDDSQARELISRLCRAEVRKNNVSSATVSWGGDQRAKDGGVDVRVVIEDKKNITGYIPRNKTIFQVKAVKTFTSASINKEMMKQGKLLPPIANLASDSGAYIITSTKSDVSDSALRDRIASMQSCIAKAGLSGQIHADFYDSQKIADWTEQFPAIVIWIRSVIGQSIVGWKPYTAWAYREDNIRAEYILDDKVKVKAPNSRQLISIEEAISQLRQDLQTTRSSIRIVGLSGVGKTRLVQALFDERIVQEVNALDQNCVIYTDISDNPTPQPNMMVELLLNETQHTIVIVDNCGADTHSKLTELVKRQNSNVSLVTLEYDIQDDLPDETQCYRLETSSEELVEKLVARRFPELTHSDIKKIAEFSGGNARVAFALAGTSEGKGQLSKLENNELFKRLFWQSNTQDENLLRSAEICSLLYSFNSEDISDESELSFLASLCDISVQTLNRHVIALQKRGLIQQRGKWKALLPHAIANRLAEQALENHVSNVLGALFSHQSATRIIQSFSHRLNFLHESDEARSIVCNWLNPGGRYADLNSLDTIGIKIFQFIAPVDQSVTLAALLRASEIEEFISIEKFERSYFTKIAKSLAYEENFFDSAVMILLRFAKVEPSNFTRSPARKDLESLFTCYLSGTLTPPSKRGEIIKKILDDSDEFKIRLGIDLIMSALKTRNFTSYGQFDFGAHSRGYGWQPKNIGDLNEWFSTFITLAHFAGMRPDPVGVELRRMFAKQFRELWACVQIDLSIQLMEVAQVFHSIDGWPGGWHAVQIIKRYDSKRINSDSLERLKQLEILLAPKNLNEEIRVTLFSGRNFFDYDDDIGSNDNKYYRFQLKLEQLGKQCASSDIHLIYELLPDLLKNDNHNNVFAFSKGFSISFGDIETLLIAIKKTIREIESTELDLAFVFGLISGWNERDPGAVAFFLENAVEDDTWSQFFPYLQQAIIIDDYGYERLIKSLTLGNAKIWRFKCLQGGQATSALSAKQMMTLISKIANDKEGATIAIEVLYMTVHNASERTDEYKLELAELCIHFFENFEWMRIDNRNANLSYHIKDILDFTLRPPLAIQNIDLMLSRLIDFERNTYRYRSRVYIKPFFLYHTHKTLDCIYQSDDDGSFSTAIYMMDDDFSFGDDHFFQPPENLVIEWCQVSPNDRCIFIAKICQIFKSRSDDIDEQNKIGLSDIAKSIFAFSDQKEIILKCFIDRFIPTSWSGSKAAIIRNRISLLDELNPNKNQHLQTLLEAAKHDLEMDAVAAAKSEDTQDRSQNERFE